MGPVCRNNVHTTRSYLCAAAAPIVHSYYCRRETME